MGTPTKLRIRRRRHSIRRRRNPFLDGIASIFDFTGSLRTHTVNRRTPPDVVDRQAMWSDCTAVGSDFRAIIGDWEHFHLPEEDSKRSESEISID